MMNRIVMSAAILAATVAPAFAAVALPEPASMSLFGLGVGGAYLAKRFFNRK